METVATEIVHCGQCTFWQQLDDVNGNCRRHAPGPCQNMDEVAHWPLTRKYESCGEGVQAPKDRVPYLRCDACLYWRPVGEGIDPMLRQDQLSGWWRHAAYCARYAPVPVKEPGPRAYWRATNAADGCFDGKPKRG